MLQVSKYPCIEFTILSFRNIDSTWQDFWLLLMVLWKRALTMTVSEKYEHFVSKFVVWCVFSCDEKYALHQLDRMSFQTLVDKQTSSPHGLFLKIVNIILFCSFS